MKRRVVIVGAGGRLGAALLREYRSDFGAIGFNHAELDIAHHEQVRSRLQPLDFDLLINAAAQTNVDRCETHPEEAFHLNAEAPRVLAELCEKKNAKLIHISTDYVFDGEKTTPYTEEDLVRPISIYGESKWEGEKRVLAAGDRHLVVRVSWIFGPDRPSFIDWVLQRARDHERLEAVADKISTPTYTVDVAQLLRPLITDPERGGLLHLANAGECSWQEYAQWALDCALEADVPMKAKTVVGISLADMKNFIAKRPPYTVLATAKYEKVSGQRPRAWRDAVAEYVRTHFAQ